MARLVFVDVEAYGGAPSVGRLTEVGAVLFPQQPTWSRTGQDPGIWRLLDAGAPLQTFHGVVVPTRPSAQNPAVPEPVSAMSAHEYGIELYETFAAFDAWLADVGSRVVMMSDNPAFDAMWVFDAFWRTVGRCPFGHSARRIGDYYAGLTGDVWNTQKWKHLRRTPHTHNPVDDATGNAEAFARMLDGER